MEPTIPIPNNQILVVEYDDRIREAIVTTLQIENYYVLQAKNAADAFSILEKSMPDLILADMNNPEMDGVKFFNKISHLE